MMNIIVAMRRTEDEEWTNAQKRAEFLCDGINDQVQIRAAIDAMGTEVGTVWLAEGEYDWGNEPMSVPENVTLRGVGVGKVICRNVRWKAHEGPNDRTLELKRKEQAS